MGYLVSIGVGIAIGVGIGAVVVGAVWLAVSWFSAGLDDDEK